MDLTKAQQGTSYIISGINTDDEELNSFLFTLGCYIGEQITIISVISDSYVVVIKDARYTIDKNLAECIIVD
ncbi:MAG: FeoA family protein [bacterium]